VQERVHVTALPECRRDPRQECRTTTIRIVRRRGDEIDDERYKKPERDEVPDPPPTEPEPIPVKEPPPSPEKRGPFVV
jgi:hypothetical protein